LVIHELEQIGKVSVALEGVVIDPKPVDAGIFWRVYEDRILVGPVSFYVGNGWRFGRVGDSEARGWVRWNMVTGVVSG